MLKAVTGKPSSLGGAQVSLMVLVPVTAAERAVGGFRSAELVVTITGPKRVLAWFPVVTPESSTATMDTVTDAGSTRPESRYQVWGESTMIGGAPLMVSR